ncbi:hypothetical protein PHLGIDRAFT_119737 [Phlebiopsis gigantea 11061_1 CR5-6]|uniref:Uncharacterized protein n=1 Tax=Phlebiopsis gigantea (strain 11061_1 CR5-6) TaxID=745531 RepID=A0A0C3S5B3_PHLG1|nr:hypothetical protein PHLGIDRAFT_119737 [Phlebiopsis gigantea 11061_1 CR5-6]
MAVLIGVTMGHLEGLPIMSTTTGCAYKGFLQAKSLFWIPGLVFEPILFLMVAYKAWSPRKDFHPVPLITQMARDSMLYFVAVFLELLVSTVVWAHAPQYINIFNPWSAALPSLMGSRLMLSMREAVAAQDVPDSYILENFTVTSVFAARRRRVSTFDSFDEDDE